VSPPRSQVKMVMIALVGGMVEVERTDVAGSKVGAKQTEVSRKLGAPWDGRSYPF
jgi:hypothetical protein